jgi:alkyldihydroxyacetonephosphate synthase
VSESDKVAEELQSLVPGRVVTNVKSYLKDSWPILSISQEEEGSALVAVRPMNVEEVAKVVRYAAANKMRILCRGGGSSVTGASIPHGEIVVDMTGMNQVLDLDEDNRVVTVQAGIKLAELEPRLSKNGFTLGQFPRSYELATVGGYVSSMGTGYYSTKYGGIEDSVIRLQAVLPDGEIVWTRNRSTPRSSVGPDLSRILIGAEGAFGIVSAADLKLHKLPNHTWKAAFIFEDFAAAVGSSRTLMDLDVRPAVCGVYNEAEASLQFGTPKAVLLLVYTFAGSSIMEATTKEVLESIGSSATRADASLIDGWLEKRFNLREQNDEIKAMGLMTDTAEVACKWSEVLETYADVTTTLSSIDGVSGVGAHVSHLYNQGASTHFTLIFKPNLALYWSVWNALARVAEAHDATLSHHHGIGILNAGLVRREVPRKLLRLLREGVDREGTMSRGELA